MALRTPWPICATCQAIPLAFFQNGAVNKPHLFWTTFSAFANSALRGCHSCTLLFEAVREPYKHRLDNEPVFLEHGMVESAGSRALALTVIPAFLPDRGTSNASLEKDHDDLRRNFHLVPIADVKYVSDTKDVPQGARHFKDLISLYEDDDGLFRYIKEALTNCLTKHGSICNRVMFPLSGRATRQGNTVNIVHGNHGMVVAPTRLIYVGSEDYKDPPRLVDGQECLRKGGHLILSYCWGMTPKDAPWQLTAMNIKQFATEIPLSILPQTLHDAIMWTRRLGERYIWIDSMCIQQDSKDDWELEASRMASTYGCASMTIVAGSSSVYGGMSDRRNPLRNSAAGLFLQDESSASTIYLLPNGQPRNSPAPPPTDSRGWCYQEDLLSSRLVKMTQKSVIWQCIGDGSNPNSRAQGLEQLSKHPSYRWYTLWYRLIERYSNKSITYPKDKLLAFYGIACDKIGSKYLAGFIKTDPWASLLWCRDENQIQQRPGLRYEEYVAPTWSWASIDVPVLFYEANSRHWRKPQLGPSPMDPELNRAEVQPVSFFDTGAVKSGIIEISAYAVMVLTASTEPFLFNTRQGAHTYGRRNCVDPLTGKALGLIVFDVALEAKDDMLLCCILLHTADMTLWEKNGTAGLGLALRVEEATSKHLKCTRVGYVQFTSEFAALSQKRCIELS
ncbi:hypothetical protein MFRU_018g01510 [Monilinia fructicola]|uniref:Heterokaryon incompatibility domain-containing protein n=1 Tax=Monilinia fructicola TaxID=38448 RepID=A0A5M9JU60_MONFR|nr:hypothetical protein EYC84_002073 [Monilinia fructicola]KAG4029046.1 hypothetical protein MFRU_018g01510 [Monilinia fructicola]